MGKSTDSALPRAAGQLSSGVAPRLVVRRFTVVVDRRPAVGLLDALPTGCRVVTEPDEVPVRLRVEWPGSSVVAAVTAGIHRLESLGLRVLRVQARDWVTQREIAERVGRSRETVRLWATGRMGPGGFPPPLDPGAVTSLYSWVEVRGWLRGWRGCQLPAEESGLAAANLVRQLRALAPGGPDLAAMWRLLARPATPGPGLTRAAVGGTAG